MERVGKCSRMNLERDLLEKYSVPGSIHVDEERYKLDRDVSFKFGL